MGYGKNKNGKTVWHYLKVYFLSLFLSLIIFAIGSFFKPTPCANSKTCESDLSLNINNNAIGTFHGHKIIPPKIDLAKEVLESAVLGVRVSDNGEKHVYVDLSAQTLYAYEGTTQIMKTLISSGKWGRTPVGNYNIWTKLRATRMAGGQGADAYDLPNVPWVMYYHNDFGLHGAYWHNNFGYPMSHGCVNMRPVDARELYSWADGPVGNKKGTAVSVCKEFTEPNKCIQD